VERGREWGQITPARSTTSIIKKSRTMKLEDAAKDGDFEALQI